MRNQKGITLIALVITIIVLLILAGVAIAMLSGENGILSNANKSNCENAYSSAEEQMGLAYMAVRTQIMAEKVADSTYNPSTLAATSALQQIVANDLQKAGSKFTVESIVDNTNISYTGEGASKKAVKSYIRIKYSNDAIDQGLITPAKAASGETPAVTAVPRYDTDVYGIIVIDGAGQTASFTYDVDKDASYLD